MIRYNFHRDESGAYMVEDADGEYVRYAEVHPLVDGDLATQRAICDGLPGPNDRISGIRLVKLMQGQRDECAEVLREIMAKLREQFGPTCMDQSIDPHAWTLAWETLTSRAYAVLSKCPSYAQQVQNICDGLGITREELDEALKRIPATGTPQEKT